VSAREFAAAIWIDGVHDTRLLTGNQRATAVRQIDKDRRRSEIMVGPFP
jgi:hypothetical protein